MPPPLTLSHLLRAGLLLALLAGCSAPVIHEPATLVQGVPPSNKLAQRNQQALLTLSTPMLSGKGRSYAQGQVIEQDNVELQHVPDNLPFACEWIFNRVNHFSGRKWPTQCWNTLNQRIAVLETIGLPATSPRASVADTGSLPFRLEKLTLEPGPALGAATVTYQAGPPQKCLAMSGGGIRSAYFNIGVLKAMHHAGELQQIDAVAAVSGGAYALSWYLSQHLQHGVYTEDVTQITPAMRQQVDRQLFAVDGPYQAHLVEHSATMPNWKYGLAGASALLMTPINLAANGVFGMHANTTPSRNWYELALRKTFQKVPDSVMTQSRPQPDIWFNRLREFSWHAGMPLSIFNTTALIEDDARHLGGRFANAVYEFTPLQMGSDAFGRFTYESLREHYSLAKVVSISGAAVDGVKLISGQAQRLMWSALNQDLGYYINNPNLDDVQGNYISQRTMARVLPFPLYFMSDHYLRDMRSTDIYLSDGGHSDNLGVFSLARRLCQEITVVDAGHDPHYEFEDYHLLKQALAREMHVELSVPGIDGPIRSPSQNLDSSIDRHVETSDDPTGAPNVDPLSDPMCLRWRDDAPFRDAVNHQGDPWHCARLQRLRPPTNAHAAGFNPADYSEHNQRWQHYAANPVMAGEIRCLPNPYWGQSQSCPAIKIRYIKLAYQRPATAPALAADRAVQDPRHGALSTLLASTQRKDLKAKTCNFSSASPFPQDPTSDQGLNARKFCSYRSLGLLTGLRVFGDDAATKVPEEEWLRGAGCPTPQEDDDSAEETCSRALHIDNTKPDTSQGQRPASR